MSEKKDDCARKGAWRLHRIYGSLFACLLSFIILVLLIILIIWLILRPTHPRFLLQDATIYAFNLSGANLLTTTMQVTISSRNPNDRIGVYYDRLDAFAAYKGQQITVATALPPGYQGHHDVDVWSPYLYGMSVPLAPYLASGVMQDQNAGYMLIYVKLDGKVRWKVGTWMSGHYHINVNCPAFFTVDGSRQCKFLQATSCNVDL